FEDPGGPEEAEGLARAEEPAVPGEVRADSGRRRGEQGRVRAHAERAEVGEGPLLVAGFLGGLLLVEADELGGPAGLAARGGAVAEERGGLARVPVRLCEEGRVAVARDGPREEIGDEGGGEEGAAEVVGDRRESGDQEARHGGLLGRLSGGAGEGR